MGYGTAAYNLACSYRNRGSHRDAVAWFRRAWELGEPDSLFEIARAELHGIGTRGDPRAAVDKLCRVARSRVMYIPANALQCEAMLLLSRLFGEGWLVPRDYATSMRWLRKAARLGRPAARAMFIG